MPTFFLMRALLRASLTGVVMSVLCSSALGSSLPLLEPAALKGDWQLAAIGDGKAVCEVQLSDEAVANTNAFRFSASAQCLQPLALRESCRPVQLNIVTRRNSILSAAAHAFIDTLVRTLRQQARSSRPEDRQIYDRLRLLI